MAGDENGGRCRDDTDLVTLVSSSHGRKRRAQRDICKRDLKAAVKYGKKEPAGLSRNGDRRWKYTFADIVYITDSSSTREITSWPVQFFGVDLQKVAVTPSMMAEHKNAVQRLSDMASWTSHTVVVVDQSGSMRMRDATEGVRRSDVVWIELALEMVAKNLKLGERKATDVFSLVAMRGEGKYLLRFQPYDWILYNKLVDYLRKKEPRGPGNYLPSLNAAENLLQANQYSSCALTLLFLSDGRPSDKFKSGDTGSIDTLARYARERAGKLASTLGRRLSVGTIALGLPGTDDFLTLRELSEGVKQYGSNGIFQSASLSAGVLSNTMSRLSSMTSSTMLEMTHAVTKQQRQVRKFRKEPISNLGGKKLTNKWERVRMMLLRDDASTSSSLPVYERRSIVRTRWTASQGWTPFSKDETFMSPKAKGVAFKIPWFGEGAERLVKEFREYGADGSFVGPALVAKDTRFIEDSNTSDKKEFHKVFCKTQLLAQKLATAFNKRLLSLPHINEESTPTIDFLECSVYMIELPKRGRHGYLVERMLDIKNFNYKKWNDNIGGIRQHTNEDMMHYESINQEISALHRTLDVIYEEEEESGEEDSVDAAASRKDTDEQEEDELVRRYSRRKLLVCDLQGILNTSKTPPVFELTDPVVHYKSKRRQKCVFGRTDKGVKGIHDFFKSHKCSNLCRMLQKRWVISPLNAVVPDAS